MIFSLPLDKLESIVEDSAATADRHHDVIAVDAIALGAEITVSSAWLTDFAKEILASTWREAISTAKAMPDAPVSVTIGDVSVSLEEFLKGAPPPGRY